MGHHHQMMVQTEIYLLSHDLIRPKRQLSPSATSEHDTRRTPPEKHLFVPARLVFRFQNSQKAHVCPQDLPPPKLLSCFSWREEDLMVCHVTIFRGKTWAKSVQGCAGESRGSLGCGRGLKCSAPSPESRSWQQMEGGIVFPTNALI